MSRFKVGDRVAHRDRLAECGTIEAINVASPHVTLYDVKWDGHTRGQLEEEALAPCPGSHTDQAFDSSS